MLFPVSTYSEYPEMPLSSLESLTSDHLCFKSLILCNYLLPEDSSSDMVVIQVESYVVYLINSDTLLTTVHLFLSTGFVLDWKTARFEMHYASLFPLQSYFVVSAQQILSSTRQSTLANVMLTNIMQARMLEMHCTLGKHYCHENLPRLVCWGMKGHMEQTGVVPVISALWSFSTNWYQQNSRYAPYTTLLWQT